MISTYKVFYPDKFTGGGGGSGVPDNLLWMYMVIIRYNIEIYCNCRALPETQAV